MDFPDEPMVDTKGNVVFGAFYNSNSDSGIFYKPMKKGLSAVATTMAMRFRVSGTPTNFTVLRLVRRELLPSSRAGGGRRIGEKAEGQSALSPDEDGRYGACNRGATFVTFDDLSIDKKGDTAVDRDLHQWHDHEAGVFLFTSNGIIPIVLNGDALPGTGGTEDGTVPEDIDGPWVNDNDDVAFAADHINAASSFEGSVFLKPFNQSLQALLLMGAAGPAGVGGTISSIGIGRPALNNSDVLSFNAESDRRIASVPSWASQLLAGASWCAPSRATPRRALQEF